MRMLWSRSASLMRTTRMSSAIARNIFRMFSACCCSWLWVLNFDSLVTPSTRWATSGPNRSSTSARLYSVSSGTSWRSAALTATGSMPSSARIWADAIGWVTYGSPEARTCVWCASTARSNALVDQREVGLRVVRPERRVELPAERLEVPGGRLRAVAPAAAPSRRGPRRAARRCLLRGSERHLGIANDGLGHGIESTACRSTGPCGRPVSRGGRSRGRRRAAGRRRGSRARR